jgi:hypothetical protein
LWLAGYIVLSDYAAILTSIENTIFLGCLIRSA